MPKQRQVTTTADTNFIDVVATIPLHYLKITPDGDRNVSALEYKLPDDNFATTYTTDVSIGDIIERLGPGRHGLLGTPADFRFPGQAATVLIKLHFVDNSAKKVNVYESETNL